MSMCWLLPSCTGNDPTEPIFTETEVSDDSTQIYNPAEGMFNVFIDLVCYLQDYRLDVMMF